MRILLISGFFPPTHVAGSEKRTLGYAQELHRLGHGVQVLCAGSFDHGEHYWNGSIDEVYRDIPVRRVYLNWKLSPDPNRYLFDNPVVAEHLDRWLGEWQPDVVHIISCYTLSASIISVLKRRSVPIVLTLVDFWFVCPRVNLLHADGNLCDGRTTSWECLECLLWGAKAYRWSGRLLPDEIVKRGLTFVSKHPVLSRQRGVIGMAPDMDHRKRFLGDAVRKADRVVAPSRGLADMMRATGLGVDIQVVYSGHDLTWVTTMPPRQPSTVIRFGYIGHIHPMKGVEELIVAFQRASFDGDATLAVYGDPNGGRDYFGRICGLLMEQSSAVDFRGAFRPEQLGEVLSRIDVVVVPSLWSENNPRVLHEAFAGKAPVIASNVAGIAEFVEDEVSGLLFERGDVSDMTRQMRRIIEDPELLAQLRAGVPPVKTIEEEVLELTTIYEELVTGAHDA